MTKSKINFALFAMATTFFAVGVTEFISVGVLPAVSDEFHISTSTAGLITTLYALGTSISTLISWRVPFLAITILGVIALIMNMIVLPNAEADKVQVNVAQQLQIFKQPHILLTLLITILGYGGTFATFTYLSPILEKVTMVKSEYISIILLVYGIAIAIGNSAGGKFGDSNPVSVLFMIFIIQAIALVVFYFTSPYLVLAIINIIVLGLFAFMSVIVLQSYILILADSYTPQAMDIASSLNISSFSFGRILSWRRSLKYMGITQYSFNSWGIIDNYTFFDVN